MMLDVVRNEASPSVLPPFELPAQTASPELALLLRQTQTLEYIASQLELLSLRVGRACGTPLELEPDYDLATRRLLLEAI